MIDDPWLQSSIMAKRGLAGSGRKTPRAFDRCAGQLSLRIRALCQAGVDN